jgi:dimethylamine monooxygenase subunit A
VNLPHTPWSAAGGDFAIGLRPIPEVAWLEGGEADPAARKDPLIAAHPAIVWGETPGSCAAQAEVLALVDAVRGPQAGEADLPPLLAAARRVSDDLCLMEPRDGAWRLTALSLCAPSFFTAQAALGKSLAELHAPVDGFAARFGGRLERIFSGLRAGLILERRNWTVVNSDALFTPDAAQIRAQIPQISADEAGQILHLRVERQTLRRLPASGGALFTIRIWRAPLESLDEDPERLAAFARAWRGATAEFRNYKGFASYDMLMEGFLRARGESYSVNEV